MKLNNLFSAIKNWLSQFKKGALVAVALVVMVAVVFAATRPKQPTLEIGKSYRVISMSQDIELAPSNQKGVLFTLMVGEKGKPHQPVLVALPAAAVQLNGVDTNRQPLMLRVMQGDDAGGGYRYYELFYGNPTKTPFRINPEILTSKVR
jgi:hypothetical protein